MIRTNASLWKIPHLIRFSSRAPFVAAVRYQSHYLAKVDNTKFSQFCHRLIDIQTDIQSYKGYAWPTNLLHELGGNKTVAAEKLAEIANRVEEFNKMMSELKQLNSMKSKEADEELLSMIEEEEAGLQEEILDEKIDIIHSIIKGVDTEDCEGVLLEVVPGVGGIEASLFAAELYEMYLVYLENNGYTTELMQYETNDVGGLYKASVVCTPGDVYGFLRHESGTHRVQRVPQTESKGRIHTSTASVAVIPKFAYRAEELRASDLKKSFSRSSGSGGQHVNTTNSKATVTHVPTGLIAVNQETRVQADNLHKAVKELTFRVQKLKTDAIEKSVNSARYRHLTMRDRSDKIRTYNFPQDRITDHRFHIGTKGVFSFLQASAAFTDFVALTDERWTESEVLNILNALMDEVIGVEKES